MPALGVKPWLRLLYCAQLCDVAGRLAGEDPEQTGDDGREARAWLEAREADCPFSFDSICTALGLPADKLRRLLLADPGKLARIFAKEVAYAQR